MPKFPSKPSFIGTICHRSDGLYGKLGTRQERLGYHRANICWTLHPDHSHGSVWGRASPGGEVESKENRSPKAK